MGHTFLRHGLAPPRTGEMGEWGYYPESTILRREATTSNEIKIQRDPGGIAYGHQKTVHARNEGTRGRRRQKKRRENKDKEKEKMRDEKREERSGRQETGNAQEKMLGTRTLGIYSRKYELTGKSDAENSTGTQPDPGKDREKQEGVRNGRWRGGTERRGRRMTAGVRHRSELGTMGRENFMARRGRITSIMQEVGAVRWSNSKTGTVVCALRYDNQAREIARNRAWEAEGGTSGGVETITLHPSKPALQSVLSAVPCLTLSVQAASSRGIDWTEILSAPSKSSISAAQEASGRRYSADPRLPGRNVGQPNDRTLTNKPSRDPKWKRESDCLRNAPTLSAQRLFLTGQSSAARSTTGAF
ncbi:hypothetical protein B0H13DRAFT_2430880 [Mycena leptocephala]|nr:hypothetical protein B0H13DRAFT_2430880 [Mycena leptocephala]